MKDRDGGTFELNELFQEEFNNNKIEEIFIEKKGGNRYNKRYCMKEHGHY